MLFTSLLICLAATGQTTQEEYNYITKGYKTQIEQGLDMKKGYSFKDIDTSYTTTGTEKRECIFKALYKTSEIKPCAILMIYKRTDISTGVTYYICIPSYNATKEIWNQTLSFITSTFKENDPMLQTIIYSLMKFSSLETTK